MRSVFQPIVDLETGSLFGFEALAGRPRGTAFEQPDDLFAAVRAEHRLAELDSYCPATALTNAARHAITAPLTLFVNVEPDANGFAELPQIGRDVRGIVELTERRPSAPAPRS